MSQTILQQINLAIAQHYTVGTNEDELIEYLYKIIKEYMEANNKQL